MGYRERSFKCPCIACGVHMKNLAVKLTWLDLKVLDAEQQAAYFYLIGRCIRCKPENCFETAWGDEALKSWIVSGNIFALSLSGCILLPMAFEFIPLCLVRIVTFELPWVTLCDLVSKPITWQRISSTWERTLIHSCRFLHQRRIPVRFKMQLYPITQRCELNFCHSNGIMVSRYHPKSYVTSTDT